MSDWSALAEAADNLRRLNRAVAGRYVADNELRQVARAAGEFADRLEAGALRSKLQDFATIPWLVEMLDGGEPDIPVGAVLEFDPFSACSGALNPASLDIEFRRDGESSIIATAVIDPMFQGPPERVHGGVIATIIDEAMGAVNRVLGARAFTVNLTINYRAAAPLGEAVVFRAWLDRVDGRKVWIRAEGHCDDGLFVEAEGLFIRPADGHII